MHLRHDSVRKSHRVTSQHVLKAHDHLPSRAWVTDRAPTLSSRKTSTTRNTAVQVMAELPSENLRPLCRRRATATAAETAIAPVSSHRNSAK